MTAKSRIVILVLAVVGLAFASASTWVHYKLLTDASYISPCDVNATFNCSQVYLSPYGSIWGVPVAIGGMFWFALVAAMAAFGRTGKGEATGSYIFVLSIVAMAAVLYLGHASYTMKTACILCMGTYVSVVGIFLTSGASPSIPLLQVPGRILSDFIAVLKKPAVAGVALAIGALTATTIAFFPKEGTRPQAPASTPEGELKFDEAWAKQPRVDLGIPADGAKVIIVKFNDFQCPMCRITHEWYQPVFEKFEQSNPGALKYVLKDWPWNSKCNSAGQTLHPGACEAAVAWRIARAQSQAKEHEMIEWLFAHQQPAASPEEIKAAAGKILGVSDFDQQYQQKLPEIRRDISDGVALGINGTPTYFINGVRLPTNMPPAYFELAIQLELNKAAGAGK
jgi:protein-disulfide isomerase